MLTDDDRVWIGEEIERLGQLFQPGEIVTSDVKKGQLVTAVEFLRIKAGPRSEIYLRAAHAVKESHVVSAVEMVRWCLNSLEELDGLGLSTVTAEAAARVTAATDLMEQVDGLLNDRRVHPAAPVMLAGAALDTPSETSGTTSGLSRACSWRQSVAPSAPATCGGALGASRSLS